MRQRPLPVHTRLYATVAMLLVSGTAALAGAGSAQGQRDPDIAVQEEFSMAAASDTAESWKLFIARHPGHPLAEEARKRLRALPR